MTSNFMAEVFGDYGVAVQADKSILYLFSLTEQVSEQDHVVAGGVRDHVHSDSQAVELEGDDGGHQIGQPLLPRYLRGRREKARGMVSSSPIPNHNHVGTDIEAYFLWCTGFVDREAERAMREKKLHLADANYRAWVFFDRVVMGRTAEMTGGFDGVSLKTCIGMSATNPERLHHRAHPPSLIYSSSRSMLWCSSDLTCPATCAWLLDGVYGRARLREEDSEEEDDEGDGESDFEAESESSEESDDDSDDSDDDDDDDDDSDEEVCRTLRSAMGFVALSEAIR